MNFIKNHVRLFEILFCIFTFCLAAFIPIYSAANTYRDTVNDVFNTSDERYETADGKPIDMSEAQYFTTEYSTEKQLKSAYEALCREVEQEGIVLLENDGALPLKEGASVSLFGQGSIDFNYATSGSSATGSTNSYANLKEALEECGFEVNQTLWDFYQSNIIGSYHRSYGNTSGYSINEAPCSVFTSEVKNTYKQFGDAAIVTISRDSGEGHDLTAAKPAESSQPDSAYGRDGSYLSLSDSELELLTELSKVKGSDFSSIIVLLNTSAAVSLDFLDDPNVDVDAVLWVGNTGSHGALAIGDVLCGKVNPSGRSVDTYVKDNFSSPAMMSASYNADKSFSQSYSNYMSYDYQNSTNIKYNVYVEGIYVGYRYYETRYEDYVMGTDNVGDYDYGSDVAYTFGRGLSYSDFSYSGFSVVENGDGYDVSVTVTNNGPYAGKEVVEVYLQKPYTGYDIEHGVEKAAVELVGYTKTPELEVGESKEMTVSVAKEQFKSYDSDGAETYILDAGDYYLTVAKDAHEATNNILAAKGYTVSNTSSRMDVDGDDTLAKKVLSQEELDTTTYSVSTETGAPISNQFDYADTNRYDTTGTNAVTYVSRSDWTGTLPDERIDLQITAAMETDLRSDIITYDQTGYEVPNYETYETETVDVEDEEGNIVQQTNVLKYDIAGLRELDYDDPLWETLLDQMSYDEQSLLVTAGYHSTVSVESVSKPRTSDQNGPTSVDGSVTGYCLPSEGIWAATFNDDLIKEVGEIFGEDCIMAGIQGLYAPGVNIHRSAFCGRTHEYFSEDPYLSGMASVAEIKGIQEKGVIAYVKHFAFNELETNRNGIGIWLNEQSAREIYLLPFEYSMRPSMGADSHGVMTSFNRAGCKWTGASSELLLNVGRDEWGYDGFYITDMSDSNGALYMTYYDGILNGTNLYDGYEASLDSYNNNARFCCMLRESCHRILYNVANYSAAMNGFVEGTVVIRITPWWQSFLIALIVIASVGIAAALVFYILAEVFKGRDKAKADNGGGGVRPRDAEDDCETSDVTISSDDRE